MNENLNYLLECGIQLLKIGKYTLKIDLMTSKKIILP